MTQLRIPVVFLLLAHLPFWLAGQGNDSCKVEYLTYTEQGKVVSDTVMMLGIYPKCGSWTYVIGNDTLRIDTASCHCGIRIYRQGNLVEEVYDPAGEEMREINTYYYNEKGQKISNANKTMNLPLMITEYVYDDKGRLKREYSNTARYGYFAIDYVYRRDRPVMKIISENGRIEKVRIKQKD